MTEHSLGNKFYRPVTRQDFQKEASHHVRLPGSWPKSSVAEKVLNNKILLTRTLSTTSNLLPRAFQSTHKFNLLPGKCSVNKFCCRELSHQQVTCCTSGSRGAQGPSPPQTLRFGGSSYTIWRPSVQFKG